MPVVPFDPKMKEILFRFGEVILPKSRLFPAYTRQSVDRLEAFMATANEQMLLAFPKALWMIENGSYPRYLRPMSKLSPERRLEYLMRWAEAPYPRQWILRLLSTVVKISYYDDAECFATLGMPFKREQRNEDVRWLSQITTGQEMNEDEELEAEVVVVGTGAGGAAAAYELAKRGNAVVMVEAGEHYRRQTFTGRAWEMQRLMYYDYAGTYALGNVPIPVPFGRCVGGTTTINSGTCFRTPRKTLRTWREDFGIPWCREDELEEDFAQVEQMMQIAPAEMKYVGENGRVIARGAEALGYHHGVLSRNAPDCDGQGVCAFGCPTEAKRGTNVSYVPAALTAGANLFTGYEVEEILTRQNRAEGVRAVNVHTGKILTIKAPMVLLACGSLFTPLLLMKNKLANSSGQVGRNLSIHPAVGVNARMPDEVRGWESIPQGYQVDEFHHEGILFEGSTLPFELHALINPAIGREMQEYMEDFAHVASFGYLISDTSRGQVKPHPVLKGSPLILYRMNEADQQKIKRGLRILTDIYFAAGADWVMPPVHLAGKFHTPKEAEAFYDRDFPIHNMELSAYHPLGTARMGADPRKAVVDTNGESFDIRNLFIADGSILPGSPGVNPMVTICAFAHHIARYMDERLRL